MPHAYQDHSRYGYTSMGTWSRRPSYDDPVLMQRNSTFSPPIHAYDDPIAYRDARWAKQQQQQQRGGGLVPVHFSSPPPPPPPRHTLGGRAPRAASYRHYPPSAAGDQWSSPPHTIHLHPQQHQPLQPSQTPRSRRSMAPMPRQPAAPRPSRGLRRRSTGESYAYDDDAAFYDEFAPDRDESYQDEAIDDVDDDDESPTEMELLAARNAQLNVEALRSFAIDQDNFSDPLSFAGAATPQAGDHVLAEAPPTIPRSHDGPMTVNGAPRVAHSNNSATSAPPPNPANLPNPPPPPAAAVPPLDDLSTLSSLRSATTSSSTTTSKRTAGWLSRLFKRPPSVVSSSRSSSSSTLVVAEEKKAMEPALVSYADARSLDVDRVAQLQHIWVFQPPDNNNKNQNVWVAFDFANQLAITRFANEKKKEDGLDIVDSHVARGTVPVLIVLKHQKAYYPATHDKIDSTPIKCIPNTRDVILVRKK
ncbi:hypothetical protein BC940DRAFT_344210 [Gongronella butleri]|nr:hypothetical protein BC940DRAFT_344210 [Gongronella butleri]